MTRLLITAARLFLCLILFLIFPPFGVIYGILMIIGFVKESVENEQEKVIEAEDVEDLEESHEGR